MRRRYQREKQKNAIFPLEIKKLEAMIKHKFKKSPDDLFFSTYEH